MKVLRFFVAHHVNGAYAFFSRLGVLFDFTTVRHAVDEIGAREDTGEGIVILLREGIVLVVVALRAGHRQAKQRSCQGVNLFSPFLRLHLKPAAVVIFVAKSDVTQRG